MTTSRALICIVSPSQVRNHDTCLTSILTDGAWVLDVTLQQVHLLMAQEEKSKAEAGNSIMHDVSSSAFLLLGMDIQCLQ